MFASQADQLYVFQRTPNYTIPARNAFLDPEEVKVIKADYSDLRARAKTKPSGYDLPIPTRAALETSSEDRLQEFESKWENGGVAFMASFKDLLFDKDANDTAAEFIRKKIRETVKDPKIANLLSPNNVIGC